MGRGGGASLLHFLSRLRRRLCLRLRGGRGKSGDRSGGGEIFEVHAFSSMVLMERRCLTDDTVIPRNFQGDCVMMLRRHRERAQRACQGRAIRIR